MSVAAYLLLHLDGNACAREPGLRQVGALHEDLVCPTLNHRISMSNAEVGRGCTHVRMRLRERTRGIHLALLLLRVNFPGKVHAALDYADRQLRREEDASP